MAWNKYLYEQLEDELLEIRLITVLASTSLTDPVRCTMHRSSLLKDQCREYETISYVWGDSSIRSQILVDGCSLDISANTERALRRFRHQDEDRLLWIDGVCIDQTNLHERSVQVAHMARIYSSAKHCLIWLGDDNGIAGRAKQSIDLLISDATREAGSRVAVDKILNETQFGERYASAGLSVNIDLTPLWKLFDYTWFTRLWGTYGEFLLPLQLTPSRYCYICNVDAWSDMRTSVVQEAALSKMTTCHCGEVAVPLRDVLTAARWLRYKFLFLGGINLKQQQGAINAALIYRWAYLAGLRLGTPRRKITTLFDILGVFNDFGASDHKDYIRHNWIVQALCSSG